MKNGNLYKGRLAVLYSIAAFLLVFCLFASNTPYGTAWKAYAAEGTLTESVNLEGVVYKEIEPGKMQLVEWAKNISWKEVIEIPETVTYDGKEYTVVSIGDNAFYNNAGKQSIAEVVFPDTIESIGENAFCFCTAMNSLNLPPNLKEVGNTAFLNCLIILNPDTVYERSAFSDNRSLVSITLPDGMTSLGGKGFLSRCVSLAQIDLPESLTSIPDGALSSCTGLTEIQIPLSVNTIGGSAFYGCTGLKEVVVPEGVTEISGQTFCNCSEELSVTFPDSVTSVHNWIFWNDSVGREKYSKSVTVKCTSREVAALVAGIGHQKIELNGNYYS